MVEVLFAFVTPKAKVKHAARDGVPRLLPVQDHVAVDVASAESNAATRTYPILPLVTARGAGCAAVDDLVGGEPHLGGVRAVGQDGDGDGGNNGHDLWN